MRVVQNIYNKIIQRLNYVQPQDDQQMLFTVTTGRLGYMQVFNENIECIDYGDRLELYFDQVSSYDKFHAKIYVNQMSPFVFRFDIDQSLVSNRDKHGALLTGLSIINALLDVEEEGNHRLRLSSNVFTDQNNSTIFAANVETDDRTYPVLIGIDDRYVQQNWRVYVGGINKKIVVAVFDKPILYNNIYGLAGSLASALFGLDIDYIQYPTENLKK